MATTLRFVKGALLILAMKFSGTVADDSVDFTYNGFTGTRMSFNGATEFDSSRLLRLTHDPRTIGRAFYSNLIQFKNSSKGDAFSFSTAFIAVIAPEYPQLGGHGIAFMIAPSMEIQGVLPSQYLAIFNFSNNGDFSNHVFAVELDTVQSLEFGDIDDNHVGIDINSLRSAVSAPCAYFSSKTKAMKHLDLKSGKPIQVWAEYDGENKVVNVTLSPLQTPKPQQPLLSFHIDLSPILLNSMYVGFSASTGSLASDQYILGWSFKMNGQAQPLDLSHISLLPRRGSRFIRKRFTVWAVSLTTAVLALTAISLIIYAVWRRKYAEILEDWEKEYGSHRYSYKKLFTATGGFGDKQLLGRGGFGRVYRGVLPSSEVQVAVKRVSHESKQGLKEFVAEIASLGRLRHRNLVQLLGYCRRKSELLLVYGFMPNGSLDKLIFDRTNSVLSWVQRFKILKGVASGLLYLHEEWEQIVIHRDVKASNVLLDFDLNGRLGDFGLARLCAHGTNPQTTHVAGTLGYLAPELARTGKATTSSDVFAFGALLLEVACGRRPIQVQSSVDEIVLVDWVSDCWRRGTILESSDPRLGGEYVSVEMELVLKLGLLCSHPISAARPSMRQVMQFLDFDAVLPEITPDFLSRSDFAVRVGEQQPCTFSSKVPESILSGGR